MTVVPALEAGPSALPSPPKTPGLYFPPSVSRARAPGSQPGLRLPCRKPLSRHLPGHWQVGDRLSAPLPAGVGGVCHPAWSQCAGIGAGTSSTRQEEGDVGVVGTSGSCGRPSLPAKWKLFSAFSLHQITNSSCAGGAGPQSHPLATGTSLSPVARQPPGATRVTAVLISQSPCFHCVSLSAGREPRPTGPEQRQGLVPHQGRCGRSVSPR